MNNVGDEELIETINECFEDYLEEGYDKLAAVSAIIEEVARITAESERKKRIAFERFLELLKGEESTRFYRNVKGTYDRLSKK